MAIGLIGTTITRHHPRHPISWLFSGISIILVLDLYTFGYAAYDLVSVSRSQTFTSALAAFGDDLVFLVEYGFVLTPLRSPDRKFPSTRWQNFGWFLGLVYLLMTLIWMLDPGPIRELPSLQNPFEITNPAFRIYTRLAGFTVAYLLPAAFIIISAYSMILRYRYSPRTLVYGTLTLITMTLCILVVGIRGSLLQLGDRSLVAFLTTGLAAFLFQPLR